VSNVRNARRAKLALSRAQKAAGQIPPDLANRVTELEQSEQEYDTRVSAIEDLIATGASGSITVVTGVDFTAQTTTIQTITFVDGIITGVS